MRLTGDGAALLLAALLGSLSAAVPARAGDEAAVRTVQDLYAAFSETAKAPAPLPARVEAIAPAIERAFDTAAMARTAVGAKWSSFTSEQQSDIAAAFRRGLTVTYASRLARAQGGCFEVTPRVETRGSQRVIPTRVITVDGDESDVDFVMSAADRIQDVLLNGDVSEVAAQRTALGAPLKAGGAAGVATFLRERADGMLAAQPAR